VTSAPALSDRPLGRGLRTRLRAMATLLKSGGLVVITPPGAGEDDPADLRSLIQFDGDMVTSVAAHRLGDQEILDRHFARVWALLADLDHLRRQLLTAVAGAIVLVPALWSVGAFLASDAWDWAAIWRALVLHIISSGMIATTVVVVRRWLLGRVLRWGREEFGASVRDHLFPDEAARLF
jgi:hypothetical protein